MSDLTDKLEKHGFKPIIDGHCVICNKPINSEVDGLYCSIRCEIISGEQALGEKE